jgi:hypothetical protein
MGRKAKKRVKASKPGLHSLFSSPASPEEEEWFNWPAESVYDASFIANLHRQIVSLSLVFHLCYI